MAITFFSTRNVQCLPLTTHAGWAGRTHDYSSGHLTTNWRTKQCFQSIATKKAGQQSDEPTNPPFGKSREGYRGVWDSWNVRGGGAGRLHAPLVMISGLGLFPKDSKKLVKNILHRDSRNTLKQPRFWSSQISGMACDNLAANTS